MSGAAVAIILIKERHVAEAFQRAGATSPEKARSPDELNVGTHGIGWRRLSSRAILREAAPGKWYLDMPSWVAMRSIRRRTTLVLLAIVLAIAAFALITSAKH